MLYNYVIMLVGDQLINTKYTRVLITEVIRQRNYMVLKNMFVALGLKN
mgnify:CR=1 FL=1